MARHCDARTPIMTSSSPQDTGQPLRVLLIEDVPEDLALVVAALQDGGYAPTVTRVETAEQVRAALDRPSWDVVLSDYRLPAFSGMEALALVRERDPDMPFIVLSGLIGEEMAVAAMKAGAQDVIMKDHLPRLAPAVAREINEARIRRERLGLSEALQRQAQQTSVILNTVEDGIYMLDGDGVITFVNPAGALMFGYRVADVQGRPMREVLYPRASGSGQDTWERCMVFDSLKTGAPHHVPYAFCWRQDGTPLLLSYVSTPVDAQDATAGVVVTLKDISETAAQKAAVASLEYHALHDPLTHLPNRTLLHDRLQQTLLAAQQDSRRLALMMVDMDRFKEANEVFGHLVGDLLLREAGARLRRIVREIDTVARIGGDEFALLLQTPGSAEHVTLIATKVLGVLRAPFEIEGRSISLTSSVGISLYPDHGEDADVLLQRADMALCAAKRTRSGYALYVAERDQSHMGRMTLAGDLRKMVSDNAPGDQFLLHYQPKVDTQTGCTLCVEALIRWNHPQRGLIPPVHFIPLAEETGLIAKVTPWVVKMALVQGNLWEQAHLSMPVVVNLSARDLYNPTLSTEVQALLDQAHMSPPALQFEVTESAIMSNPNRSIATLARLGQMGIRLSIDDFGTGYSSLSYLKKLPVHEIKIDKSFVREMASDPDDVAIVHATIDLAHNLGLTVVAEGVENRQTLENLARMGCDAVQGYYICRPSVADDLTRWLMASPATRQT